MAHADHFLERLSRTEAEQTDLALQLYRDPELTRKLLAQLDVPEGCNEVALCLADQDNGPWIVVSRAGAFITCLGPGMEVYGAFRVGNAQLRDQIRRIQRLREQIDLAAELKQRQDLRNLYKSLYKAHRFSREDALALAPLMPVLGHYYWVDSLKVHATLLKDEGLQDRAATRQGRLHEQVLDMYWLGRWGVNHQIMLLAHGARAYLHQVLPTMVEHRQLLAAPQFYDADTMFGARGAWAVGCLGKPALAPYKQQFVNAELLFDWLEALACLATLGLRHSKLTEEVTKTLLAERTYPTPLFTNLIRRFREKYLPDLERMLRSPDDNRRFALSLGKLLIIEAAQQGILRPPYAFTELEAVPDELALPYLVNELQVGILTEPGFEILLRTLPLIATATLADLYLPADLLAHLEDRDRVGRIRRTLTVRRQIRYPDSQLPATRPAVPGRNEPCSCGSGKKYKKCCGT